MKLFRDRCLLDTRSLLWNEPGIWTIENLQLIKAHFIDRPDLTPRTFWEKFNDQCAELPPDCMKVLADAMVIYGLPSTFLLADTKWSFVEKTAAIANLDPPKPGSPIREALEQGVTRTGPRYSQKHLQLCLIILFAMELKEAHKAQGILNDPWETARLIDRVLFEIPPADRAYGMRHTLLHMLFPETFGPILSGRHKRRILNAFRDALPVEHQELVDDTDRLISADRGLLHVRETLRAEGKGQLNFYSEELVRRWNVCSGNREPTRHRGGCGG